MTTQSAVSELQGIGRIKIHEGKLEEFKRVVALAIEVARTKDLGTLQYEFYFNDDESECIVLERYRDSQALLEHGAHLGELAQAILAAGDGTSVCLGEPSAELRKLLAGSPVQLFRRYLSMEGK